MNAMTLTSNYKFNFFQTLVSWALNNNPSAPLSRAVVVVLFVVVEGRGKDESFIRLSPILESGGLRSQYLERTEYNT